MGTCGSIDEESTGVTTSPTYACCSHAQEEGVHALKVKFIGSSIKGEGEAKRAAIFDAGIDGRIFRKISLDGLSRTKSLHTREGEVWSECASSLGGSGLSVNSTNTSQPSVGGSATSVSEESLFAPTALDQNTPGKANQVPWKIPVVENRPLPDRLPSIHEDPIPSDRTSSRKSSFDHSDLFQSKEKESFEQKKTNVCDVPGSPGYQQQLEGKRRETNNNLCQQEKPDKRRLIQRVTLQVELADFIMLSHDVIRALLVRCESALIEKASVKFAETWRNLISFQEYHVMLYEGVMENTCHCRGLVRLLLRRDRYNQGFLQSCHQHLKQLELKVTSLLKQKQGWPAELPNLFRQYFTLCVKHLIQEEALMIPKTTQMSDWRYRLQKHMLPPALHMNFGWFVGFGAKILDEISLMDLQEHGFAGNDSRVSDWIGFFYKLGTEEQFIDWQLHIPLDLLMTHVPIGSICASVSNNNSSASSSSLMPDSFYPAYCYIAGTVE